MNKILFLTEVPTAHLDELHPLIDGHFCIASECLKDPAYFEWYKNRPKNASVMLDNGMFEEGKPLSVDELFELCEAIQPNVVFAPDQVGDKVTTLEMSKEFHRKVREAKKPWNVAFIPQGANPVDIAHCYYNMASFLYHDKKDHEDTTPPIIGISFLNDRPKVIAEIQREYKTLAPVWHHFLGMYGLDEIKTWPQGVYSCDTIKPFKAAFHGYTLEDCPRGLGKWDTSMQLELEDYPRYTLMYRNIARMHQALTRR